MKGLLLKDIYMAVKYCRVYFLIAVVFAVAFVWSDNFFLAVYPVFLVGALSVNLLSYDEKCKWSLYAGTFPYTRTQLVSVKYIVTLLALGLSVLLMGLGFAAHMLVADDFQLSELLTFFGLLLSMGLASPSLMLPIIFRFGVEKGRIAYYGVLVFFCAAVGAVGAFSKDVGVLDISVVQSTEILLAAALIGAILFAGSWLLSVRIYAKRELS